jgi:hypothetical protein
MSRLDVLFQKSGWLRDLIEEGGQIVDLGPAPTSANFPLPSSVFRVQENLEVAGYSNHFTRLEYVDHGQPRMDKGEYVPPTIQAQLGAGSSIDFAKLEHHRITLMSHQILTSPTFAELTKLDPFDLLTGDGSIQFGDATFNGLLSDLLESITNLGSVCDKVTQTLIGPIQQTLRLCKYKFYARIDSGRFVRDLTEPSLSPSAATLDWLDLRSQFYQNG